MGTIQWVAFICVLLSFNMVSAMCSLQHYSKETLDWSISTNSILYDWNNSYVDSNEIKIGSLLPSQPIVFIQQHLVAFSWRAIGDELGIQSMDDLVGFLKKDSTLRKLKIGVDRHYALLFRDFLNYKQIGISTDLKTSTHEGNSYSISPFIFFRRNCRPRHVLEDFDIIVSTPGVFLEVVRFYRESSGKRKQKSEMFDENHWNVSTLINPSDFIPFKLAPAIIGYEYQIYPFFLLANSSYLSERNSYFVSDIITLYQHYEFGNVSSGDIEFLNFLLVANSDSKTNFTTDQKAFTKMIQQTETFLNCSLDQYYTIQDVYSNYFSSAFHYCTDSTCNNYLSNNEDFWNIPVLFMVTIYFIALFGSTFFLRDSFKRRMMVPYLPVTIYFFELTHSQYFNRSCLQVMSFLRMLLITWIIGVYILTVMRFYLLRNLYSILSNPLLVNSKISQIQFVKRVVSPLNSLLLIILISGVASVLFSIHGVVMFFDLFYFESDTFEVVNVSFVVYILAGCSLGIITVLFDFIINWKVIKVKGFMSFLRFDDPFKVRIDLISMILLLIIAIIHVTNPEYQRVFFFLECLLFLLMCGGFTLLFETLHTILKKRNQQQLSELENYLKDENFKKLFKDFSSKEFSLENIVFYDKITNLKQQYGSSSLQKSILDEIDHEFLASNSTYELNIPSSTRRSFSELKKRDSSSATELFELFLTDVIVNLNDTLSRLVETSEFQYWHNVFQLQCTNSAHNNL